MEEGRACVCGVGGFGGGGVMMVSMINPYYPTYISNEMHARDWDQEEAMKGYSTSRRSHPRRGTCRNESRTCF